MEVVFRSIPQRDHSILLTTVKDIVRRLYRTVAYNGIRTLQGILGLLLLRSLALVESFLVLTFQFTSWGISLHHHIHDVLVL